MEKEIEGLLKIIEDRIDWGPSGNWQGCDFENLRERIAEVTGVYLSTSTLQRIWGKIPYGHKPGPATLNTLAKFAEYENWRDYLKKKPESFPGAMQDKKTVKDPLNRRKKLFRFGTVATSVISAGLLFLFTYKKNIPAKPAIYQFSSEQVTRGIPNSVVFKYDASAAPTDSVYIQQSWDAKKSSLVDKSLHTNTSVYYEPGFYHAKLVVGKRVVKEHPLLIPSNGWLGVIKNDPVPVYLKPAEFIFKDMLRLDPGELQKTGIAIKPSPPVVKFYNVGNFKEIPVTGFSFSAAVKNEYGEGAAACQFAEIALFTDDGPIVIPLSIKGCISELNLCSVGLMIPGKKNDLSGFGVDFSRWNLVSCRTTADKIQYFVNGSLAYQCQLPTRPAHIVGMEFAFLGTGAVKNIQLNNQDSTVFRAF